MKVKTWRAPDHLGPDEKPRIPIEDTRQRALAWARNHPSPFRRRTRRERGLDK